MVMKNYAKYLIGIGIITITIFVWYSQYSDLNTIDYQIFKYERGYFCNKIIKKVPKYYRQSYEKNVVEKGKLYKITYVREKWSSVQYFYYYIEFINQPHAGLLSAPPHYRFRSNSSVMMENYMSYIVDIELFNMYTKAIGLTSVEEKINHYIRFLERRDDSIKSIYPIKNKNDLEKVSRVFPMNTFNPEGAPLDIDKIELDTTSNFTRYYWISYAGLYKYSFTINKQGELQVESKRIGFVGNEAIFM